MTPTERDPTLSDVYRRASHDEPPSNLDHAILSAAHQAAHQADQQVTRQVTARRPSPARQRPSWFAWLAPAGVVCTVVLSTLLVLRQADDMPNEAGTESAGSANDTAGPVTAPMSVDAPPAMSVGAPPALKADTATHATASRAAKSEAPRNQIQSSAPVSERSVISGALSSPPIPAPITPPPASPPAAPILAIPPQPAPRASMADRSAGSTAGSEAKASMEATAKRSSPARLEAAAPADPQTAEAWLEQISTMRIQGRHMEADLSLERFRRAHPTVAVPSSALPPTGQ